MTTGGAMFGWLRSLLGLSGRDRIVFRYFNGSRVVGADPLRLKAALDAACPQWAAKCEQLGAVERTSRSGLPLSPGIVAEQLRQREALTADLIGGARKAFGLADYSEAGGKASGVTDLEALDVLAEFLGWVADVMEDTRPLASPPPSTESAAQASVPVSESDSPSTPTESSASGKTPSPAPSAAPSPAATETADWPAGVVRDRDYGGEG
jgi:hypothetical protein